MDIGNRETKQLSFNYMLIENVLACGTIVKYEPQPCELQTEMLLLDDVVNPIWAQYRLN